MVAAVSMMVVGGNSCIQLPCSTKVRFNRHYLLTAASKMVTRVAVASIFLAAYLLSEVKGQLLFDILIYTVCSLAAAKI